MKNLITKGAKGLWGWIVAILTYIFLMIDRTVLIPCQWVTSYSAYELQKKPDRFSLFAILRVMGALLAAAITWIITLIF